MTVGLNAGYAAARSAGVDFASASGGLIITHVWYNSSISPTLTLLLDSNYVGAGAPSNAPDDASDPTNPVPADSDVSIGGLYAPSDAYSTNANTALLNTSHILAADPTAPSGLDLALSPAAVSRRAT